jgi:hypothetical protein
MGNERVRPPRLILEGAEREMALACLQEALAQQPALVGKSRQSKTLTP